MNCYYPRCDRIECGRYAVYIYPDEKESFIYYKDGYLITKINWLLPFNISESRIEKLIENILLLK
jgi:hypothetical protein